MTVKAKRFRIGVEGATTDGREIQREWLEQMAASYNPAVYTALINLEHIKSYLPDSTFNRYGKVTALFAEEITEGPLAGKMALYADVEPTESLVELVKKGQKLFTSMEVSPKFADTGKAYLVGLAATDDPASLGTEMLTFSASAAHNPLANRKQNPANLFTAAEETVIELEEVQDEKPSLFARVTALFTKKEQSDDARFSDVHKAVELVATEQQNLSARTEKSLSEQEERLSELETALQTQLTAFNELVDKLSHEDSRQDYRQRATGGNARTWWKPSEGEQVVLLSLGGNLETAFALPAVYSNQFAPPSTSADACVTEHPDGSWFEYEPATGRWYVRGIKSMVIEAADNITMKTSEFVLEADRTRINSEVVINGGVTQGGGAMSSNGIVVDAHQHTGVLKGGDTTGGPV
ncbi:phage baseplate assembly protein V [Escherichia coli]|nr:phage baseplate assembly protein V [Escherichia coli]MCY6659731.1 phage baseplate assembly protein V [Escherichia coli]